MRLKVFLSVVVFLLSVNLCYSQQKGVEVTPPRRGAGGDVVVTINGQPFTSFINTVRNLAIGKPIFWPIYSARGTIVTRSYPMVTHVPNEQNDHPHHTGLFFTYGRISAGGERMSTWGGSARGDRTRTVEIKGCKSGEEYGLLETVSLWESGQIGAVLEQTQKNIFRYDDNSRIIDFDVVLKGLEVPVTFEDTKEGGIAIRVHRDITEKFTPGSDNTDMDGRGNGEYINAEGLRTEQNVWGKRSKWVALRGKIGAEPVVIALMFGPDSHNSPPFWHARGYGCFCANPLGGRAMFTAGKEPPLTTTINPGESINLKYRLLVYSGELTKEELDRQYELYLRQSEMIK